MITLQDSFLPVKSGNRCGHNKDFFKDIEFPNEKKRPKVIQWAMASARKRFKKLTKHFEELIQQNSLLKNNTVDHRCNRSEGRESCMLMTLLIFYNLELPSMTVRMDDITFTSLTLKMLTNNGEHLSLSRAKRALAKFVKAGYIIVTRQFEKAENVYQALASIKEVTYKFFKALGIERSYTFSREYKRKALEKRQYKQHRKKSELQRFDNYLPFREGFFTKLSKDGDTLQFLTSKDIDAIRKELIKLQCETAPLMGIKIDISTLTNLVNRYTYDTLKKSLAYYRRWKKEKIP